ncbi:hypothetical protein CEXT_141961 [Caerostris extrusa]|uniref:Uncharacterized protein n=1 Tax=Caerostris extrusa TaxID=172846 RepID=A0AAV4QMI0_CAEEX|nr:hypothetical protein CEXT_141961 [Caerostris extrusa]
MSGERKRILRQQVDTGRQQCVVSSGSSSRKMLHLRMSQKKRCDSALNFIPPFNTTLAFSVGEREKKPRPKECKANRKMGG